MALFLSISSSVWIWSMQPPVGVDAMPRYYHLASFNCGDVKTRDAGRMVDVIWAILCLIESPVIIERWGKVQDFFFLLLLRRLDIMFDNNCSEYLCWLYRTSERGKILNYKGLRQAGLIIPKWYLSVERVCGFQTWNFIWGFLCRVMFTFRYFSNQGCWGCIQSNLLDGMLRK